MAGVRGFADPNVQINPDGRSTFEQYVQSAGDGSQTCIDSSQMLNHFQAHRAPEWSEHPEAVAHQLLGRRMDKCDTVHGSWR